MSALEDGFPDTGGLRVVRFFSFLGRMVSALGFGRKALCSLRDDPRSPAPTPSETCGIDVTVSVSTIMFDTVPSPGLERATFRDVMDRLGSTSPGGRDTGGLRLSSPEPELLFPPLSLPLSTACRTASSIRCKCDSSNLWSPPVALSIGVDGALDSSTVSNGVPVPPVLRVEFLRDRPPAASAAVRAVGESTTSSSGDGVKEALLEEVFAWFSDRPFVVLDVPSRDRLDGTEPFRRGGGGIVG